ncbi:MAG: M1 family aminopeptidase [Bacteroidota bacterium]|nr:M1 family aminopeptidase [Bacteroidota bacterium]
MKNFAVILFIVFVSLNLRAQENFDPDDCCKIAHQEALAKSKSFYQPNEYLYYGFDIFYHRLEWEIDPNQYYIKGMVATHFLATSNLDSILFDLHTQLQVDSVLYHDLQINFSHSDNILSIELDQSIPPGNLDSISVYYQGQPLSSGFGAFMQFTHGQPEVPIISTLSEPYGAKDWWPCKQSLDDKIDSVDIIVTSPEAYRTASIGMLQSELVTGQNRTMHWKHRYPVAAYLIAIAVTNYVDYSDYAPLPNGDSLQILNYVFPEELAYAQAHTPQTVGMIELYSDLFIPYPFINERYGHAMFVGGGGMEHQTMSFMVNFGYELTAHELAHQWFGDYITCKSWHDIWLNEGFATYLAALTYEFLGSGQYWQPWKLEVIENITSQPDGAVYCDDTTSVNRIFSSRLSYRKGAMLLHMLRWELGDSLFFAGIKNYLNNPALAFGFAESDDLKEALEVTADTSLQEFFADWLYGEGYPVYTINYIQNLNNLQITINQATSHASVGFFEMHIPILAVGANTDSLLVMHNTSNNQQFIFQIDFDIEELIFDPELWIVTKDPIINIGIEEESIREGIKIFPNPAQDKLVFQSGKAIITRVNIFDLSGHKIQSQKGNATKLFELDISALPKGVYVVSCVTEKGSHSQRVIIK